MIEIIPGIRWCQDSAKASSRHCAKGGGTFDIQLNALILVPGRTLQYTGGLPPSARRLLCNIF
jgi:hypothetical protein